MRVLEPSHFKRSKSAKSKLSAKRRLFVFSGTVVLALSAGYLLFGQGTGSEAKRHKNATAEVEVPEKPKQLKIFTSEEFKSSYNSYIYPNTQPITIPPEITGNKQADQRIRQVAEARGYKLTSMPVASIVKTEVPGLEGDDLIQPNAKIAWQELNDAAIKAGIKLKMTSAYRSIEYQRALFLRRMQNMGVNEYTIVDGHADDELETVLSRAALPGYSRHHTGYTIDLSCNGVGLDNFRNTDCYEWLSNNNFENAKKYGWVPSYPEGVGSQGPEPESWEYVWIGTGRTYE